MSKRATPDAARLARADLARSGIKDLPRGWRVLSRAESLKLIPDVWRRHFPEGVACLLIEYLDIDGKPTGFYRLRRLEDPPATIFGGVPELPRYHQPAGTLPQLYFSPAVDWPKALAAAREGKVRVVLVEGEKKAELISREGRGEVVAIGLGGVWNFSSRGAGVEVIPDVLRVCSLALGFSPIVCFDADPKESTRRHVLAAEMRFGSVLRSQGAAPLVAHLPVGSEKMGPDDFIVGEGWRAFVEVLDATEPLFPKEELSDVGNAGRLARRAAGEYLYVPEWRRWLRWDGRRWAEDKRNTIRELAVEVARDILIEARNEPDPARGAKLAQHAIASQKRERIDAMVHLAADAWPALKTGPSDLDADPWLLNVENGTIDLRTGVLRPHSRADLVTKIAPVAHDPEAGCVLWEKSLAQILPSADLRAFVKRWFGYSLTGSVRENKLVFFHGRGQNGKNVVGNTLFRMLGDYATVAPEGLLIQKRGEVHPTELTELHGRRFVLDSETSEGHAWDEQRAKRLTGGDVVKARRMREDFWSFAPTHKFIVLSNARPRARADDEAIWLRIKLVPFEVSFRGAEDRDPSHASWPVADRELETKLKAEWSGILRWAVDGCIDWQRDGLGDPPEMREAAGEYREEQRELDPLTSFLAYHQVPADGESLKDLAAEFNKFALHELEGRRDQLTSRQIAEKLRERGFEVERGAHGSRKVTPPRRGGAARGEVVKLTDRKARKF